MRVASIGGMRPFTNMLGLGPLLKPKVLTMGKPRASILSTNLGQVLQFKPKSISTMGKPKASILSTNLGRVLQLKPKSISTMGKPKAFIPLTAHLFEMTWLSVNMLGLGFFSSPRLHLLHSLPLRLDIILRGSSYRRRHHGERSGGGSPVASRRCYCHGGWCKCPHGRSG